MLTTHWVTKTRAVSVMVMVLMGANMSAGQDYPNKPIRIVTANVGGGSDFIARQIAQGIASPLGQSVIVENRGGIVTAEIVAKASPDGYTLSVNGGAFWLTPLLLKAPYDVIRDFVPISLIVREVSVVVVNPSLSITSIKELFALAKAKPGELNFGTDAPGGRARLGTEMIKSMTGINIVNVPYKGNAAAIAALLSGEIQIMITDPLLVAPHVKLGKLRALAVTSADPTSLVPGLPTVAASLPGYESIGMTGMFAPAKTPGVIIDRVNREVVRFLSLPEVKERFLTAGLEVIGSSPAQWDRTLKADIARWDKVIKEAHIQG